eukprot:10719633-Lingulodinium_polyedra.AAC.1
MACVAPNDRLEAQPGEFNLGPLSRVRRRRARLWQRRCSRYANRAPRAHAFRLELRRKKKRPCAT